MKKAPKITLSEKLASIKNTRPNLHKTIQILSTFVPAILVFVPVLICGVPDNSMVLLVYMFFGSMAAGLGLSFWTLANLDKDFFFTFTAAPIIIGGAVSALSSLWICISPSSVSAKATLFEFQLSAFVVIFFCEMYYSITRDAIEDRISKKTRLTLKQIDDRTEGLLNKHLYHGIHKEYDLGMLYFFNALYKVIVLLLLTAALLMPFIKILAAAVLFLGFAATVYTAAWSIFQIITEKKFKKNYYSRGKGLLSKIPFFYEIWGNVLLIMLLKVFVKYFVAI